MPIGIPATPACYVRMTMNPNLVAAKNRTRCPIALENGVGRNFQCRNIVEISLEKTGGQPCGGCGRDCLWRCRWCCPCRCWCRLIAHSNSASDVSTISLVTPGGLLPTSEKSSFSSSRDTSACFAGEALSDLARRANPTAPSNRSATCIRRISWLRTCCSVGLSSAVTEGLFVSSKRCNSRSFSRPRVSFMSRKAR